MTNRLLASMLLVVAAAMGAGPLSGQAQGDRLALVIGTTSYESLTDLDQALDDALAVAEVLREDAGFEVTRILDATSRILRNRVGEFAESIQPNDVVVVYYAGHGIQRGGRNYLLPSDFPADADRLDELALPADELLRDLAARGPSLKVLILDACRNDPLESGPAGLARMEPGAFGVGTHIEFAASAGQVATDGLFAEHLVDELARPGQDLDDVFRNVRVNVSRDTSGRQTTMSASQVTINFYFIPTQLAGPGEALEVLERVASTGTLGESGQTGALEALVQQGHSLAGTDLLQGLVFREGTFNEAQLRNASLIGTDFTGASLREADLSGASLTFASLRGSDLTQGRLTGAALGFAVADSAVLRGVSGRGSAWFGAQGRGVDLSDADLSQAIFAFADLRGASFEGALLGNAIFFHSDLRGASVEGAILEETDFTGSRLEPSAWDAVRRSGACSMPFSREPEGPAYAYLLDVLAIEPIPNPRFDGGMEYSRFSETGHLFLLEQNDLGACPDRTLARNPWSPVWQFGTQEELVSEIRFRLPHRFLQQAGRRSAIPRRIQSQLAWLYPVPIGRMRTTIDAEALPEDARQFAGEWTLEIASGGRATLDHRAVETIGLRYESRPPEILALSGGAELGCAGRPQEYVYRHMSDGDVRLRASYGRDPCVVRSVILTSGAWRSDG